VHVDGAAEIGQLAADGALEKVRHPPATLVAQARQQREPGVEAERERPVSAMSQFDEPHARDCTTAVGANPWAVRTRQALYPPRSVASKKTKRRTPSRSTTTVRAKPRPPAPAAAKAKAQPGNRPRRAPAAQPDLDRFVQPGIVALVGLVFLVAAGIGAGVLLAGVAAAMLYVGRTIVTVGRGERPLVAVQKGVVLALVFLLPVTIDPRTADVFATVKFSILATGGVLLLGLLVADLVIRRDRPRPTVVHALVGFLVVWGVVTTLASGHAKLSTLGFYSSNNGLVTLVCLALVFTVTAGAFRPSDVRPSVAMLWFATTGVVVLYGVLQLLDQAWPGHGLEPVNWPSGVGVKVFGSTGVWATFGNPNHLGGYCAIALPLGLAMLFGARAAWERWLSGAILAGLALIVGQTSSRGAWVAAFVGIVLMAVLNRRTIFGVIRRRPVLSAGGVVVALASVAFSFNSGLLSKGTSALFDTSGSTTIAQRLHFWRTTVRMAGDKPLLGFGMDGYRLTFPHFASAKFIDIWGYDLSVTGPHNTFMAHLYWGGWPALAAFVAVVVLAAIAFARAFRRLRDGELGDLALPFAAVAITGLAYLLVESFNVERLELAAIFWFAVGLVVAVRSRVADDDAMAVTAGATARPARARRPATAGDAWGIGAAAVVTLVALVWTTGPWRADNSLRSAGVASNAARAASTANPQLASARSQAARADVNSAVGASPWEARYRRVRGDQARSAGLSLGNDASNAARATALLQSAAQDYTSALALTPHEATLVGTDAEVLYRLAEISGDTSAAARATRLLRSEIAWAPRNGRLRAFLGVQLVAHGDRTGGVREIDRAVAMFPDDTSVLQYAETGYRAAGLTEKLDAVAAKLQKLNASKS
jgi:O-antigen ligase